MNIILTGGHSGIGLELTKMLLKDDHKIGLIVRSEKRKNDAIAALGNVDKVDFFFANLSKQEDIENVAKSIQEKWDKIDGLFNNAGLLTDKAYYSERGYEMQFEVNAMAPYILTQKLKPLLDKSDTPFVINTATGGLHRQKALDIADLKKPKKFVKLLGSYLKSKVALMLLMNHLASQWSNIRVASVDPGPNKTDMTSGSGMPGWLLPLRNLLFAGPAKGGKKLYNGAFGTQFQGQSGVYITGNKIKPVKITLSAEEVEKIVN